jgi:hypothetical protein
LAAGLSVIVAVIAASEILFVLCAVCATCGTVAITGGGVIERLNKVAKQLESKQPASG